MVKGIKGIALVSLVGIAAFQACRTSYPVPVSAEEQVMREPMLRAEGKTLTMLMCGSCHYDETSWRMERHGFDSFTQEWNNSRQNACSVSYASIPGTHRS